MTKEYKPGQFVSIGGKLCRVKRGITPCYQCKMNTSCTKEFAAQECIDKVGMQNYPEPVKSE